MKAKTLRILCISFMLVTMFCTTFSMAADKTATGSGINPTDSYTQSTQTYADLQTMGGNVIKVVSTIGSIASIIVLVVLGIKYMIGSAEEKAEYKKTLLPYVIGAALVFAASGIAGVVYNFTQNIGVSG